jgi:hypothetical protein
MMKWEIQGGKRHWSRCSNNIFRSTKSSSAKKQKRPVPFYGLVCKGIVKLYRSNSAEIRLVCVIKNCVGLMDWMWKGAYLFCLGGHSNIPLKKLKNLTQKILYCRMSKGTDVFRTRNVADCQCHRTVTLTAQRLYFYSRPQYDMSSIVVCWNGTPCSICAQLTC